ncbi:MAG: histidine kinase [Tissierellia bacterium]|nr:histidine kinase [Tissierellia bacterium]
MIYEKKLYEKIKKNFTLSLFVIIILFSCFYFICAYFIDYKKQESLQKKLMTEFYDINDDFMSFLEDDDNIKKFDEYLKGEDINFKNEYYEIYNKKKIDFRIILYGKDDFSENDTAIENFQKLVNQTTEDIKFSNFINSNEKSTYIITKKLKEGYVAIHIDEDQLKKAFDFKGDFIISDRFNKVIIDNSRFDIITNARKVNVEDLDKNVYLVKKSEDDNFKIYQISLRSFTPKIFFFLIASILFIAFFAYLIILHISKKMSNELSQSIQQLTMQMRDIRYQRRNSLEFLANDEFSYISKNINKLIRDVKDLSEKNTRLSYEKKLTEFKMMESQFNPHFLYNTLELISIGIYTDKKLSNKLIKDLTAILRYSINDLSFVHFDEDIEYIYKFLDIEKIKYKDRLKVEFDIEDEVFKILMPKLFLQPLIENAIKYGFKEKDSLIVRIKARKEDRIIRFIVEDSGHIDKKDVDKINKKLNDEEVDIFFTDNHHGLINTYKRLSIIYKDVRMYFEYNENTKLIIEFDGGLDVKSSDS